MARSILASLLVVAVCAARSQAQNGDPDLARALALERAMQKIIQQNESSIACILVSRSDAYQEFGQGPDASRPGKLGAFNINALRASPRYKQLTPPEKQRAWEVLLDFSDPAYVPRAFGSGVVVDPKGLILTNYHVVQDATKVFVRLPGGQSSYADVLAADSRCDLAILKLLNMDGLLKAIPLGDADKVQRGQFVLTLSNPFAAGFRDGQPSASWGILSNIRRKSFPHLKEEERIKPFHAYGTLLQTDARLNLGCSGGAMFNLHGEMVGLITSIAAIQGGETPGGFAVPVNAAMKRIIDVLKQGEEIDYGFLGVSFEPANANGVSLTNVSKGSPADKAGLKVGDVLTSVNGQAIHESDDVYTTVGFQLAGAKVTVGYRRKGVEHVTDVTLAKLYVPSKHIAQSLGARPYFRGLRGDHASLVVQLPGRAFGHIPQGMLVIDVQAGSAADKASVKMGDIITHVNGVATPTPAAFYQTAGKAAGALELTLHGIPNKLTLR
jgi:serine protease Do